MEPHATQALTSCFVQGIKHLTVFLGLRTTEIVLYNSQFTQIYFFNIILTFLPSFIGVNRYQQ